MTVPANNPTPASNWALNFFWFLSKTLLQGSWGTPNSSMLGLSQFLRALLWGREVWTLLQETNPLEIEDWLTNLKAFIFHDAYDCLKWAIRMINVLILYGYLFNSNSFRLVALSYFKAYLFWSCSAYCSISPVRGIEIADDIKFILLNLSSCISFRRNDFIGFYYAWPTREESKVKCLKVMILIVWNGNRINVNCIKV